MWCQCADLTCDDVHDTQEDSCTEAPGVAGDDLHDDREEDGEPSLGKEVIQGQGYEAVGRLQVESEGGEWSGEYQEAGLDPQPGVETKPRLQLVCDEAPYNRRRRRWDIC